MNFFSFFFLGRRGREVIKSMQIYEGRGKGSKGVCLRDFF